MPHGPHNRLSCFSSCFHQSVKVVDEVVPAVYCIADCSLNTVSLNPWLPVLEVSVSVGTHKRIVNSDLVKANPHIFGHFTIESRNIGSSKWHSRNSILHNHYHTSLNFRVGGIVITCPVSSKLLTAHKPATGQNKGS